MGMPSCALMLPSIYCTDLKAFVHEGGGVDCHFAAHAPVGVLEGVGEGDMLQLLASTVAEGAAGGGEEYLIHIAHFAHETLEDGRMFGIDGQDGYLVARGGIGDNLPSHHHSLLIGQGNGLVVFDSPQGGTEAGKAHDRGQHHINRVHLHEVGDGVHAGKDFDVVRG